MPSRIFILFILGCAFRALGQDTLDTILIVGKPLMKDGDSLSELSLKSIINNNELFINTRGASSLATLTHKGLPAKHVAIMYYDVPINGSTTGVYDIGLIPNFYFDKSTFIQSSVNAYTGSYGMTSGLQLQHDNSRHDNQLRLGYKYVSHKDHNVYGNYSHRYKKLKFNIGAESVSDKNLFRFKDNDRRIESQLNKKEGFNINGDAEIELSKNLILYSSVWMQKFHRDLPNPLYKISNQEQEDINNRVVLGMKYSTRKIKHEIQSYYGNETIQYNDVAINSIANNQALSLRYFIYIPNKLKIISNYRLDKTKANFFNSIQNRNDLSLSLVRYVHLRRWLLDFTLGAHHVNGRFTPLIGEITIRNSKIYGSIGKSYNLPNFNDLYWPNGGNINLKPEQSYQSHLKYKQHIWKSNFELAAFSTLAFDMILWAPKNNGIWQPENVQTVWARGLSIEGHSSTILGILKSDTKLKYGFTRTTNEGKTSPNEGKQLIYVPLHKASLTQRLSFKNFVHESNIQFIGKRYDTTDNFLSLKSGVIWDLIFKFQSKINKHSTEVTYMLNNILGAEFAFVRSYGLPIYQHELKLNLTLDTK